LSQYSDPVAEEQRDIVNDDGPDEGGPEIPFLMG